ncbi:phage shock protein operon transcriptional activator [Seongchinamella sediminis]|uniref:Phage shock protein operon transcriptional activator n=1 Tax=Seongchinamella sediminis TaxID=2283635 RepID=A0A3L7E2H5_9GAMM|nr:phage shock protein operon transcriptional activator [Seongchinamella sediminis]RLQ23055.1 phage shock protein operon transcriptional activator [Seongchinamella sediminis]
MKRPSESIIGNSAALALALDRISQLAPINRPVLVLGERGTGKELAADRLHYLSGRWDAPLLKTNCAALAETLLESELFGHEQGAFTGATRGHRGRFERADGGTLFLDELATMSLRLQEKLLRLIEYGEFERLGGQQTLQVDVRVVAATNADLPALAREGKFRADLLDRLSFDVVHLPALRHRQEDIPELAQHFAVQMSAELGWELFQGFTDEAMAALCQHPWPGNIRELKNSVERSLYRWADSESPVGDVVLDPFASPYITAPEATPAGAPASTEAAAEITDFTAHMDCLEKRLLQESLARHGHHQRHTAEALGLSYDQMRGLVRKHGLSRRQRRGGD